MTVRAERRRPRKPVLRCTDDYERAVRNRGFRRVAGVDEVGRGCLFGPVFAAAVILSPDHPIGGINDSKRLTPHQRERLAGQIRERAVAWAVGSAEASEIDRINILEASRLAMRRAVEKLSPQPDCLLIDALTLGTGAEEIPVIHGDALCLSIAAASILAKVDRDALMKEYDLRYPGFLLARNKGYGTPDHLRALRLHGPTPEHRESFAPVRDCVLQTALFREEAAPCH